MKVAAHVMVMCAAALVASRCRICFGADGGGTGDWKHGSDLQRLTSSSSVQTPSGSGASTVAPSSSSVSASESSPTIEIEVPLASASGFGSLLERLGLRRHHAEAAAAAPSSSYPSTYKPDHYRTGNCYGYPPGTTGDPETECYTFEVCQSDGRLDLFYCPDYTKFNNYLGVCDWYWNVDSYCNPYYQETTSGPEYYNFGEYHGYSEPYSSPKPYVPEPYYPAPPGRTYKEPLVPPYYVKQVEPPPPSSSSVNKRPIIYIESPHYEEPPPPPTEVYSVPESKSREPYVPRITFERVPLTYLKEERPSSSSRPSRKERPIPLHYRPEYRRMGYDEIYDPTVDSPYLPYYLVRRKYYEK
ncbi:hypothetical protein BV898_04119 [Hypsibius exemplaris]|uniref:Chitin-binding type-2 domain-containing protein n=1 Tax=Hypsibius exemplaris TaxID=2072580 RepID=A0A1W0X314_HYPEX|nr:hypothetical protein BV898_04119 [Hypsibius exemplaris]